MPTIISIKPPKHHLPYSLILPSFSITITKAKWISLTIIMDQSTDFYGYLPSKPAALFGIVYFGTATITCTLQMIVGRYPHYWMTTIALAGVGEALGWGARLWAHIEVCQVQ